VNLALAERKRTTKPRAANADHWRKGLRYFKENPDAKRILRRYIRAGCKLKMIGAFLREYLHGGPHLYEERRKRRDRAINKAQQAIKGFVAATDFYRDLGRLLDAARMEFEKSRFENFLVREKQTKPLDTKKLGALHAKELPGALIYLVELQEYVAARTGTLPTPQEMAWLVEAILTAFDHPKKDVDPNLLATRLKQFRARNPMLTHNISAAVRQI